jgi:uncharacterized membrane protein YkvA (DUF1232 family)
MALWLWAVVLIGAAVALLAGVGWWLARSQGAESRALAQRVGQLPWRSKARLAWALLRDARVPLWLRAAIPALVLYLALPLDIIPDFIPILGYLDDLLVIALVAGALVRFTPRVVLDEHLAALEAAARG